MSQIPLSFEQSVPGRRTRFLPALDAPRYELPQAFRRKQAPRLPEMSECDVSRHYTRLANRTYGVNDGFYPLGSCTMKYNPAVDEAAAALDGFLDAHPLAPEGAAAGCQAVMDELSRDLCALTGMDAITLSPAAGAHGELTGMLIVKQYHEARGDLKRVKMLVPDSAHGTNPASAAMAGFTVVNVKSREDGLVDLDDLDAHLGDDVAGIMLTNPNTLGLFERDILQISDRVHKAGGLLYYDGANLNAILGVARPGDMGFDVTHLNLHKTFATPHGGGGPGCGPVGVKGFLAPYLPGEAMGGGGAPIQMKRFHGNFTVMVKALCYLKTLGAQGAADASRYAVLNANYLMHLLRPGFTPAHDAPCMHEFVLTLEGLKKETGVSALDVAKAMIDRGMHPPTMYFPLIVHEALMFEPTETESKQVLDEAAGALLAILAEAKRDPERMRAAPHSAVIGRPDEVAAARNPVLRAPAQKAEQA